MSWVQSTGTQFERRLSQNSSTTINLRLRDLDLLNLHSHMSPVLVSSVSNKSVEEDPKYMVSNQEASVRKNTTTTRLIESILTEQHCQQKLPIGYLKSQTNWTVADLIDPNPQRERER
ncbi:hypothetical protein CHS0354_031691 [Potamilus streckersoni]|uniref:Uncharacterized protein n=1 Tax=Potamilus streckersoni TaxID=2493646 RepID=A0AAE0W1F2_9BIVA|nr:hypothetical protein CHS0354_031691 [Potamilus streckersoni]